MMVRRVRRTVLIVCEGKTDIGFIKHLRKTYCSGREGPPEVTPKQSHGKGGDHVIDVLLREIVGKAYDVRVALIDADEPPSPAARKKLKNIKGVEIIAEPCLEGLLLRALGENVPPGSNECKKRLSEIGPRDLSNHMAYEAHWNRECLQKMRVLIPTLDALIRIFETGHH